MLTVHHLNNSRSQRVLWLLEELGLLYEVKRYERDKTTMLAPPSLKAVHPLGLHAPLGDRAFTVRDEQRAVLGGLAQSRHRGIDERDPLGGHVGDETA